MRSRVEPAEHGRPRLRKIHEWDAPRELAAHAPGLEVDEIATLPGGALRAAAPAVYHPDGTPLPSEKPYPPVSSRHYRGDLELYRGGCVVHGDCVLPESFRWPHARVLQNRSLRDTRDGRAVLRRFAEGPGELPVLDGDYFHLDYLNSGHYGHLLVEALPRLWAWRDARARLPALKVLLRRNISRPRRDVGRRDVAVLRHLGVSPDDVAWCEQPVRVTSLVGAAPTWHGSDPHFVHPGIRDLWDRIRRDVVGDGVPGPERVFLTRHGGNRPCGNVAHVDALFARCGFTVVDPARMSFEEQVATLAGARAVAGLGGTGVFNVAWTTRLEHLVVLNHRGYWARNEELFAHALGAAFHLFLSDPDAVEPGPAGEIDPAGASWRFDPALEPALLDVLRSL